jgi:hypothetical protein
VGWICRQPSSPAASAGRDRGADDCPAGAGPSGSDRVSEAQTYGELIAEEEAAKAQTNRVQRQEAAIERWRSTPANGGNDAFLRLGRDLEKTGMSPR